MNKKTNDTAKERASKETIAELIELLEVEEIDRNLYRGKRKKGGVGRIFGGQVIAQALMSAIRSIEDNKAVHSLHAYFMRPGDEELPIIFRVERDFDGGSFSNRRVIAIQKGQPILNFAASFQRPEEGFSHSTNMPAVPPPEGLQSVQQLAQAVGGELPPNVPRFLLRLDYIDIRPVQPPALVAQVGASPRMSSWFRAAGPIAGGQPMHRAMLAYISDMMLLGASLVPHAGLMERSDMQIASLDHALWFHHDVRMDDWLLYTTESPWAGQGRGYTRGAFFTRDGTLIASVTQEGLIRKR